MIRYGVKPIKFVAFTDRFTLISLPDLLTLKMMKALSVLALTGGSKQNAYFVTRPDSLKNIRVAWFRAVELQSPR